MTLLPEQEAQCLISDYARPHVVEIDSSSSDDAMRERSGPCDADSDSSHGCRVSFLSQEFDFPRSLRAMTDDEF